MFRFSGSFSTLGFFHFFNLPKKYTLLAILFPFQKQNATLLLGFFIQN